MSVTKVLCVLGTRPEAIKIAPVIHALNLEPKSFQTRVLATAQHRRMLDQMLAVFSISPDTDLDLMRPGQELAELTGRVLAGMTEYLSAHRFDLVLAQGDTTTAMVTALACFYARIPFGHIEAGLRTGDLSAPYPEEFNRRVIALATKYHFAPTASAADNLLKERILPELIFITGNTVIDALFYILHGTESPPHPIPEGREYVLMTCHRREIFGDRIREVFATVRDYFSRHREIFLWYPVHPNPEVAGPAYEILSGLSNIILTEPLDYIAFSHAMNGARLLLSDSGGVQEEAPALGKPVLVLRDVTERPEGVAAGTCLLVGPHRDRIEAGLNRLLFDPREYERMARARNPYGDGKAAGRIVAALKGEPFEPWRG
ncbi:MAG: UDP-N-acetylglucosamine 2-epimerase (non-hydrolyzing) [Candidatus Euphemobacter frigidus]|nr:UDP-N-acetylglucosamine 2-epimerase (non-hydrolyzing) [Candidatus Euphemobacter frigidus]MDP8276047.1 UDP-N-acetylglucosamine 2-epimerase (non-hydrolyzing) [Candidatus Euphemobacter frigidus]